MAKPPTPSQYLTWEEGDERGKSLALSQAAAALKNVEPILRSHGSTTYLNIAPGNVSVRDEFNRGDYESFRNSEALPRTPKESIVACNDAYLNVGIVRNIIDLMGDFAVQGIDINHPNERIEKFFKAWFRKVAGPERSERFLNYLYRSGNVIVKRQTAKLTLRDADNLKKAVAEPDVDVIEPIKLMKREVPWRYTFLNPLSVELLAEELSPLLGHDQFTFALKISQNLSQKIRYPKTPADKELIAKLPQDIASLLKSGKRVVPLDPDKIRSFYYKRDDWQPWAYPMVHSILTDLMSLRKMKLADLAALDGAISCIRVWKLGDVEARILPSEGVISRLAEMLANNVGGGVMDLVWGPDINLLETNTDVHHFLGDTKYAPVLTSIYAGLGVPPTLTGAAVQSGFTNNFISLQTLTERLEYGRTILREFWEYEMGLVQRAMNFRFPATLVFDRMTLSDEASEKQLLINLADRDIISWESLVERFGETPEIETVRLRREARKRKDGQMPSKASPFHEAEHEFGLKKIFAQGGSVTPSEVGLELEERKSGEKPSLEMRQQGKEKGGQPVKHGVPGQGRPKMSKDTGPRKQKEVKPRTSAQFVQHLSDAETALAKLAEIVTPIYLKSLGKKNLRQLTNEQAHIFEDFKFSVLCQFELGQEITTDAVREALSSPLLMPANVNGLYRATIAKHVDSSGCEPSLEVLRRFQAATFAVYRGDYD